MQIRCEGAEVADSGEQVMPPGPVVRAFVIELGRRCYNAGMQDGNNATRTEERARLRDRLTAVLKGLY
jgi:hypothetical protein